MRRGGLDLAVVLDLVSQNLSGLLKRLHVVEDITKVSLKQIAAISDRGGPFAAQCGEVLHVLDGHVGCAQTYQESDPVQIRRGIAPLSAACAMDRCEQTNPLVVAKGMSGQTCVLGDLCN